MKSQFITILAVAALGAAACSSALEDRYVAACVSHGEAVAKVNSLEFPRMTYKGVCKVRAQHAVETMTPAEVEAEIRSLDERRAYVSGQV
jgi:hypothetical protein